MSDDVVTIVIDARKEKPGLIRELVNELEQHPGTAEVFVEIETSEGRKTLTLTNHRVEAGEMLYAAIRNRFGLSAVPGRMPREEQQ